MNENTTGTRVARTPGQAAVGQGGAAGLIACGSYVAATQGVPAEAIGVLSPIAMVVLTLLGKLVRNLGNEFGFAKYFA